MDVLEERLDVRILGIETAIDGGAGAGDVRRTGRVRHSKQGRDDETAVPKG